MALATVLTDTAPLFERPSPDALRLDELLYGLSVQIIQESETGWCYLRTEWNVEGYVPSACLQRDATVAGAWRRYKKVTVLAPYIDVQKEPVPEAPRIVSVPRGGILVSLAAPGSDGWQKVGLVNGAVGYTRASYLGDVIEQWDSLAEEDVRWNLVETALSYNGVAWRCGGRTPMGIDALGLVTISYFINGILLPQETTLRPGGPLRAVNQKAIREGDVLYFASGMGIYIGDGRFVHATDRIGGEGVVVSSLRPKDEDYRGDLAADITAIGSLF